MESLLLENLPVLLFVLSAFRLNLTDEISGICGSNGGECNIMDFGNTVQLNNLENYFVVHNIKCIAYIQADPRIRGFSIRGLPRPEKYLEN